MSSGYGAVREYRDDPRQGGSREYRDNPFSAPSSRGYQSRDSGSSSIQELCDQIRNNIFQINNGANAIERALKSIGTDRDTPLIRDKIHETSTNTNKVVQATTRLIRSANALKGDKQQRIQIDRLTSDFQESISRFQTLQKKATEKVKSAVKLGSHHKPKEPQPLVDIAGIDETHDRQRLLEDDHVAELQAQEVVIEDDLALLREREERIRQLESDVLNVNEIFRDLGTMISDQREMLNDIEANVEITDTNIERGNEQLVKASEYQQSICGQDKNHNDIDRKFTEIKLSDDIESGSDHWDILSLISSAIVAKEQCDYVEKQPFMRKSRKKKCCLLVIFLVIAIVVTIIIVVAVKTS